MRVDPIWAVLIEQGRSIAWLARRMNYSTNLLYSVKMGRRAATAEFRRRACLVLQLPEAALFLPRDLTDVSTEHTAIREDAGVRVA